MNVYAFHNVDTGENKLIRETTIGKALAKCKPSAGWAFMAYRPDGAGIDAWAEAVFGN